MANLFGPSPTEIMAARQKELEDRQQAEYIAMLETAKTPAERTYMMAGRTLSQALSPLIGGGAGANDPMLNQARVTQAILSKYGPESFNDPEALSGMAKDFASFGMNNEAFQLAGRAMELRKALKGKEQFYTATGTELMKAEPNRYKGLDPEATYVVNSLTGKPEKEKSEYKGDIPEGYQAVQRAENGRTVWKLEKDKEHPIWKEKAESAGERAKQAAFAVNNVEKALKILGESWTFKVGDGTLANIIAMIPGLTSKGKELRETIGSIQAQLSLDKLAQLKELSRTGASGLGPINIKEFTALERSIKSLNPEMGITALRGNLIELSQYFNNIINNVITDDDPQRKEAGIRTLKQFGFLPDDWEVPKEFRDLDGKKIYDYTKEE